LDLVLLFPCFCFDCLLLSFEREKFCNCWTIFRISMDLLVRKHLGCHTINQAHQKHRAKIKCNHQKHRASFKHKRKRRRLHELGVCILLRSNSRAASSATSRATNQDHPNSEEESPLGLDLSSRANSTADNAANYVGHEFGV